MIDEKLLEIKELKKSFSGIYALSEINFDLIKGEIHCLVGENGAGKSTFMKILSGAYIPDSGDINILGENYTKLNPNLSKSLGISIIYQENDLVQNMSIAENIFIGNEIKKNVFFYDIKTAINKTSQFIKELGIKLNPLDKVADISVADKQFVKILKALVTNPKILIMDEPTSMFNIKDAKKVLDLVKRIADKGVGIIYISHFLEEVREIADRISVIRDGKSISTYENFSKNIDLKVITKDMVGRSIDSFYTREKNQIGDVVLEVKDLKLYEEFEPISFSLKRGEILGFSGMVGSGRTEIVRAITGADSFYSGEVYINGSLVKIKSPKDSIKEGFAHITEDRQALGLGLRASVLDNISLVAIGKIFKGLFNNIKRQKEAISPLINDLHIKVPSVNTEVIYLSGGNQQKVVLAKWLLMDQNIYIFDEPTRGIDIGAKSEFYSQMSKLCKEGKSIIMISSDMPELISMSDRVLVIRDHKIETELIGDEINEENIIEKALGVN